MLREPDETKSNAFIHILSLICNFVPCPFAFDWICVSAVRLNRIGGRTVVRVEGAEGCFAVRPVTDVDMRCRYILQMLELNYC